MMAAITTTLRSLAALLLVVVTLNGTGSAARPPDVTATNVLALETWVTAVKGHTPGQSDGPARAVSR